MHQFCKWCTICTWANVMHSKIKFQWIIEIASYFGQGQTRKWWGLCKWIQSVCCALMTWWNQRCDQGLPGDYKMVVVIILMMIVMIILMMIVMIMSMGLIIVMMTILMITMTWWHPRRDQGLPGDHDGSDYDYDDDSDDHVSDVNYGQDDDVDDDGDLMASEAWPRIAWGPWW